jgi:hypothetical protein
MAYLCSRLKRQAGKTEKPTEDLTRFETTLPQLNLFVRRRGPDEIGAVGVDVHAVPERHRGGVFEDDLVRFP